MPGQAKLVRCCAGASSTSPSICAATRPPSASGRATSSTTAPTASCCVPVGFGHGFCVLSETADVAYQLSSLYDPATEAGIAWDDPDVGVEWPVDEPLLSERDIAAPKLADVRDELPF